MTVLRVNTIAGIGTTTFGPTFGGNLEFNSQNYIVLPKGSSTQQGILRETVDVVGTGGTFYDNLVLAMPFNQATGLRDVSSRNRNPAVYNDVGISTLQSKYYGTSASFGGSTDWIDLVGVGSDFNLGTGDFTIELWMQSSVNSLDNFYRRIYMTDGPTGNAVGNFQIAIEPTTGKINLWENTGALDVYSTSNVTNGNWNHIAACRSGTTLRLFVNGTSESSSTYSTAVTANSGSPRPRIGNYDGATGSGDFNGYLQDLRVYKGIAKYTANFTPPDRIAEVGVGFTTGQLRYNTDSNLPELYDGNQWVQLSVSQVGLGTGGDTEPGARGIFPGGRTGGPTSTNTIDYINISSAGNAVDFGDLTMGTFETGSCSSSTRGLFFGGRTFPTSGYVNNIEYITFSITGNTIDFGDLASPQVFVSGASNSTRGLVMGGLINTPYAGGTNNIDYVTIASTGNAVDFGNLSFNYPGGLNQISSPTRGFFAAGLAPHNGPPGAPSAPTLSTNVIQYITIASLGNSQDFGDMQQATTYNSGCSNATRGVYAGNGASPSSKIEFITMASLGNTVTFGNLTSSKHAMSACASSTRGVWGGGDSYINNIEYVTILTQGNTVDFGDLQSARGYNSACSNAHGGL